METDKSDWRKWIDYVNQNYTIQWYNGKTANEESQINYDVINEYWNGNGDLCVIAKIFIDKIQINCHFFSDLEIENDIDPREFNSIDDHNKLMKYIEDLASILNKDVILTPENEQDIIVMLVSNNN